MKVKRNLGIGAPSVKQFLISFCPAKSNDGALGMDGITVERFG